jgi:hypothetical protein
MTGQLLRDEDGDAEERDDQPDDLGAAQALQAPAPEQ